jgi:hypothetical protein
VVWTSGEFQVNSVTEGNQCTSFTNWLPRAVAMNAVGDFVVVWTSYPYGGYADAFG